MNPTTSSLTKIDRQLRGLDPIQSNSGRYNDHYLLVLLQHGIESLGHEIDTAKLSPGQKLMYYYEGCNYWLDWLYAEHGGSRLDSAAFSGKWEEAHKFFTQARALATTRKKSQHELVWDLEVKYIDLLELRAYHEQLLCDTKLDCSHVSTAVIDMRVVLTQSLELVKDIAPYVERRNDLAKIARGLLFELLLVTYLRLKAYREEQIGRVLIRTALDREDRPWNNHAFPKRGFDIVLSGPEKTRLFQIKTYHTEDEYAFPIKMIEAEHYAGIIDNLEKIIDNFALLIDKTSQQTSNRQNEAEQELDALIGTEILEQTG